MKKIIMSSLAALVLIAVTSVCAYAWSTPELRLEAYYDADSGEVTVEYIVDNMPGVESADFELRYDEDLLEFISCETYEGSDILISAEKDNSREDRFVIQYVDMYHVEEEDCENGSMVVATLRFKLLDENAQKLVLIATSESCAMDPDSRDVSLDRFTLNATLQELASGAADRDGESDGSSVKKAVAAAAVAAAVFIGGTAAFVIKVRRTPSEGASVGSKK